MKRQSLSRWVVAGGLLIAAGGCQPTAKHSAQPGEGRAIPAAAIQGGPTLATLTGGELGMGGGFLIGASPEKVANHQQAECVAAAQRAEQSPAQLQQVHTSTTADLNNDGYVTLDEVLAMVRAGLTPQEVADRLTRTHYVFHTTPEQERYLTDRGVKPEVVSILHGLNNNAVAAKAE